MVDGDGTYEFKHINRLLDRMVETDAEMVLASRMFDPTKLWVSSFCWKQVVNVLF
jgi:hypothetical protein